jgi:hypothetical protein
MFPETVSAISFVLGCVSFLLSSLPNIYQKKQQISQCREFLQNFERQFRNLQGKYEAWRRVWGGLPEEKYRQAWGTSNVFRVQRWTADIRDHFRRIEVEVRGPRRAQLRRVIGGIRRNVGQPPEEVDQLNDRDLEWWKRLVEQISQNRSPTVVDESIRKAGIPYRIAFAFFKNDVLKLNLDNLAKTVEDLDKFTTYAYWKLRWSHTKGTPTELEVNRSLRLQDTLNELNDFARLLYEAQRNKNQRVGDLRRRLWTLELRPPDLTGNSGDLNSAGRIDIDFCLVDHSSGAPSDLKRARILYKPIDPTVLQLASESRVATTLEQLYGELSGGDWYNRCRLRDEGFRSLISAPRCSVPLRTLFERNILREEKMLKASVLDRATLAVGLGNWTLLLWMTDWTSEPCCCRIRFHQLPRSKTSFTLSVENHACDLVNQQERKIVSLGVVLTEILLGTPMRARPPLPRGPDILGLEYNRLIPWLIQKWRPGLLDIGGYWETVKLSQVLQDLKEKLDIVGGRDSLVEAIGFCLDNPPFSSVQDFPVEALEECVEKVLSP